jgi:ornithine--oxo-acid transaminase
MMCVDWDDVRPDILVMGKSMSGGMLPVSGCVADDFIMKNIGPGDHGSTYGGNPLAMATSMAAVKAIVEEGMVENSEKMGDLMMKKLRELDCNLVKEVRGRGLFIGVEIKADAHVDGNTFAQILKEHGLLTKATHDSTVRLTPPIVITEAEVNQVVEIIGNASVDLVKRNEEIGNQ